MMNVAVVMAVTANALSGKVRALYAGKRAVRWAATESRSAVDNPKPPVLNPPATVALEKQGAYRLVTGLV
jgi:hypothetical protein